MADVLEQFLAGGKTETPTAKPSGSPSQYKRDVDAMRSLQDELTSEQKKASSGDQRAARNVEALQREIALKNKIIKKSAPSEPVAQAVAPVSSDPLEAFFSGKAPQPAPAAPSATTIPVAQPSQPSAPQQAPIEQQKQGAVRGVVNRLFGQVPSAGQVFGQFQEGKRALGERVAGAVDVLYSPVPAIYGAGVQGLARLATTPEEAERIGQQAAATIDKPMGKAFGITGKETYQQPLGGITEPVAKEINRMFNVLGMTPEQISEKTGIPAQDIRNMVVIGSVALPQAVKETVPVVKQVSQAVTKPIREAAAELQVQRPGATAAEAQAQFQAMQAKPGSVGAAAVSDNPYAGKFTGEELGGSETFPQIKLTKITKDVPVAEQQLRSQLFQEVLPGVNPRPGVVTVNDNLLRN